MKTWLSKTYEKFTYSELNLARWLTTSFLKKNLGERVFWLVLIKNIKKEREKQSMKVAHIIRDNTSKLTQQARGEEI